MVQLNAFEGERLRHVFDPRVPLPTARAFIRDSFTHKGLQTLRHYGGQFFAWDRVCYREMEKATVKTSLFFYLEEARRIEPKSGIQVPFDPTKQKVNEVLGALESVAHLPTNVISIPGWLGTERATRPDPRELVLCSNGILHLPTAQLLPSTPEFFSTNALNFPFEPNAPEPTVWLGFLNNLWLDDPESTATLQEIFGYLLVSDTRQQKMFLLIGPKRSGKGTIGRVLRGLLGPENVRGPTLAALSTNFGLQPLIGKQLATISDARLGPRTNQQVIAERLLSISGEDIITIDRKYLPAWTGQLICRILMLTNELPRIADVSGALASRFIVLRLTKSFFGHEDHTLTDRLLRELPGILNWSIQGWERLQERGHFLQPESGGQLAQSLEDLGSPLSAFVRARCEIGSGKLVMIEQLHSEYCSWCHEHHHVPPPDVQTFGRDLRSVLPTIQTKQRRVEGKQVLHYIGIGLR